MRLRLVILIAVVIFAASCGQKGDLYIPDELTVAVTEE
jgi:predicted small lipoprotein YifL